MTEDQQRRIQQKESGNRKGLEQASKGDESKTKPVQHITPDKRTKVEEKSKENKESREEVRGEETQLGKREATKAMLGVAHELA